MSLSNCATKAGKSFNAADKAAVFAAANSFVKNDGMTEEDAGFRAIDELIASLRGEMGGRAVSVVTTVSELSQEPIGSSVITESSQLLETSKGSSVEFKSNEENTSQTEPKAAELVKPTQQLQEVAVNTTEATPVVAGQSGALASLAQKSPEGTSYKTRNLLADYFRQSAVNEDDATQRPLVAVKDFLSQLSVNKALEFLKVTELDVKQIQLLKLFKSTAKEWQSVIKANLSKKENTEYRYQDLTQFLLQSEGKDVDLEENVKTAMSYAAVSWIVESAARQRFNGPKEINEILDRDETEQVSEYEHEQLGHVGARENAIRNSLGQRAVQALGLKATKDAKVNLMAQLESHLGAHILKLLLDQEIVVRNPVSGEVMASLTGKESTDKNAVHHFVKLDSNAEGALHPKAQEFLAAVRGTQGVLDKLFSVESGMKEPSHTPIAYKQSKTKNTGQDVPSVAKPILQAENGVASYVHPGMWQFASIVDTDTLLEIAGAEDLDGKHAANIPGMKATNDALLREITNIKGFVGDMMTEGKPNLTKPLYFDHSMWLPQRVGIATNLINPQASKIHRHMLYRSAWETEIDVTDEDSMEGFLLRVGEGLGIKTDKQDNTKSLLATFDKIDAVNAGVVALVRMLQNPDSGSMPVDDQKAVLAAVKQGGENMHSLASLMALAQYKIADAAGESKFKTQLMGEVDGVTNGPMLSHLLLGAASTVEGLFSLLNRGGFYQQGSGHENYNLWRAVAGHFDLYETTAGHMTEAVQRFINDGITGFKGKQVMNGSTVKLVMGAIYGFTGELADKDGTVLKAGRNIIKTPLTAMVFGSAVSKAVQSMADKFVSAIYEGIEAASAGKANALTREQIIENLNVLLSQGGAFMIPTNTSLDKLMSTPFTLDQIDGLQKTFKNTLGKAVRETMEVDFVGFISQRKAFNTTAQITHEVYNAAYTAMHEQILNEQMDMFAKDDKTGIAFTTIKGERQALHDLSATEVAEIGKRLADLKPIMHTAMSKDSKQLSAGLYIGKKERKLSSRSTYKGEVKFGTGIKGTQVWSKTQNAFVEQTGMTTTGFETVASSPGVSMSPVSTHATDSATMHYALGDSQALNVHDAQGVGIGGFIKAAQSLNQSLWKVMLDYSPANEVYEAMSRTVRGYAALASTGALPPVATLKLIESLRVMAKKNQNGPDFGPGMVTELLENAKRMSFKADDIKLQAMGQMASVDQYALQGGNYSVTETDREAATAKRAELTEKVDAATHQAVKEIEAILSRELKDKTPVNETEFTSDIEEDPTPAPAYDNPFTQLGAARMTSDPEVVGWFKNDPNPTAKTVIALLVQRFTNNKTLPNQAFNLQLLKMLTKAVDPEMPVNFVTAKTREKFPQTTGPARGLFTMRGGKEQIFVLSPEFVESGLTDETLLHELTHSAVTKKIYSSDTDMKPYVDELYLLLEKAQAFVKAGKMTEWKYAVSSLDEMIAFGMTNDLFQQRVLAQIIMESKVTGFKAFIQSLTKLLFGGWAQKPEINTGVEVLIGNVTNLMAQATQAKAKAGKDITLGMASSQTQQDAINSYSTLDIFNAIDNGTLDTTFQGQLRELLGGMVEKLHGPFGAFKAAMRKTEAGNPLAVWLKALETGNAPFASTLLATGFTGNNQQDFVIEQVEATVRAALNSGESSTKEAYRALADLYTETYNRLKPADFLGGAFKTNTADEAQAMYDFVFKLEKSNGDRSDYLARFAALGLAHQGFNKLLQVATGRDTVKAAKSFTERLQNVFESVLEFFQRKVTHTYRGQNADTKLTALVDQLVDIEAKKRHALAQQAVGDVSFMEPIEDAAKKIADKATNKVLDLLNSPAVRTSGNAFVQAAGAIGRTVVGGRVDQFMEAMSAFRDTQVKGQVGIVGGLINNIKSPIEGFLLLLRASKQNERNRKQQITFKSKFVRESFANNGRDLTKKAKAAISSVFLRSGAHTLMAHFSMAEIENLLGNNPALDAAISQFEAKLDEFGQYKNAFIEDANGLGHYKAVGVNKVLVMKMNAHAIARRFGSAGTTLTEAQTARAEAAIAPLATLFALRYTPTHQLAAAKEVLRIENARADLNGVQFALQLQEKLEVESLARLFKGNPALMVHGFTPEIYNHRTKLVTANAVEGKALEDQGYSKGAQVPKDPADPDTEVHHLYRLADGGLSPHLTGVIGYDGKKAKGSEVHSGYMNTHTVSGINNASAQAAINTHRAKAHKAGANPSRDLSKEKGSYMAPVFSESGDLVNWRYLMSEHTKDTLLERNSDFDTVLGTLAGSIEGKQTTIEQNKTAIAALQEQYESEYATRGKSYVLVGPKSETEELRAVWALLPEETKQDVNDLWGREGMMVRSDSLDLIFGYRKVSAADPVRRANAERDNLRAQGLPTDLQSLNSVNVVQKLLIGVMETLLTQSARVRGMSQVDAEGYAKRLALYVSKAEKGWQELVSETKDLLVVKTGATLVGNIFSNFTMLALHGVPVTDMMKHTLVAFKGATAHRADTEELDRLRTQLATGYTQGRDNEIKRRMLILEDAITRNPVHELIEAGLMPTIVEDIAGDEDIYSFKSELTRKVEGVTSKLNPSVVKFARGVYMAHDTKLYRGLSHITQMSDFLARYALYQHETARKKDPLSKKEAIARASSAFVNYDIPMHRSMQYSDDMGFTMFTKYFLYIQRELWRVTKENPLRVYSTLLLNQFVELGPIVLDSSMIAHAGNNPIRSGALGFASSLDKLLTVSTALAIVK